MSDYTKNYQVAGYECDQESTLKTSTIFNWLQDSMDQFSRAHGIGYDFCHPKGLTYILKDYDVHINQLPKWTDKVQMNTILSDIGASSLFFTQNLYDLATKQLLLSSASHVVLLDFLNKRPARINDHLPDGKLEQLNTPLAIAHLKPLDRVDFVHHQDIVPDHIDFNQHVNNTNYVTFAEQSLDPVFLKKARLKRIQVAYKQAAKMGDKLKIETKIAPGFTDHQISSEESARQFARVRFHWIHKERA